MTLKTHTHTHTQLFYGSMDFVRDNVGDIKYQTKFLQISTSQVTHC